MAPLKRSCRQTHRLRFLLRQLFVDIKRKLENFCDDDYLLFIGDPTAIGVVSAVAASVNAGRYKCLKWDKIEKKYIPIQVDLFPKKGESYDDY